jgi:hypothetical protein
MAVVSRRYYWKLNDPRRPDSDREQRVESAIPVGAERTTGAPVAQRAQIGGSAPLMHENLAPLRWTPIEPEDRP